MEQNIFSRAKKSLVSLLAAATIVGCAGMQRSCSSCNASNFGSDWLIVQYKMNGQPINCWQERNASVDNEDKSDGIYWVDGKTRNLVHISGWYNRVQVENGQWQEAANSIGINLKRCPGGKYLSNVEKTDN